MSFSIIVLLIVFGLIAVRQVGAFRIQIWQAMMLGALAVLLSGQISASEAFAAINFDVMLFLFGMFVVGSALEESGYLSHLAYKSFRRAGTVDSLILSILFGVGLASAFLMNDTCAIIWTPVMLFLAREHNVSAKLLLLALAFAITLGSVPSPIGNPQNLLVAVNGDVQDPFTAFLWFLFLPTILNLFIAYLLLKLFYRKHFHKIPLRHSEKPVKDAGLARLSRSSLILISVMIFVKIAIAYVDRDFDFRLTYIALVGAAPILFLSTRRIEILKKTDWHTLIFFASMFVLMQSVWDSGFFQRVINGSDVEITSVPAILSVSVVLSQLISNVPLVALYLPMLLHAGVTTKALMALAAGSTVAGNLFILGAASNVIIIQNAEKKGETLTFMEFARIGIPLTMLNTLVYWVFLSFI